MYCLYIGGVFQAKDYILNPLNEELKNNQCHIIPPISAPEYGAYLLGKKYSK